MKDRLLELFFNNFKKPLSVEEIEEKLNITSNEEITELGTALNELEDEFIITHNSSFCFAPLAYFKLAIGELTIKDGGYGFVDLEDGTGIYVNAKNLNGALTYDKVIIKVKEDKDKRLEGEVVRIVKRGLTSVSGILLKYRGKYYVRSIDSKIKSFVYIKDTDIGDAKEGQYVKASIEKFYKDGSITGKVTTVIGNRFDKGADITSLVYSRGVEEEFPEEVIHELESIPDEIDPKDFPNRKDLTDKLIITIDGDDAADFDDAINVTKLDNGNYLLGVYIADVSNYVKEESFLEAEAFKRATSIYLPDRVIPMLPKKLCNGICSLNEGVYRLVMACEMEISPYGEVLNHDIFEGIIKSAHRMTYNKVNMILKGDEELSNLYKDIVPMLFEANTLAHILNDMRVERGSFEFESAESYLVLDERGRVKDIKMRQRGESECLIEEFMLIANETVASSMTWLDVPFIYRVHEEPKAEKIDKLISLLSNFGYTLKVKNKKSIPLMLQNVLKENDVNEEGITTEEKTRRVIINNALIRSMAKAKYQEQNIGHFGLASKCYTHFTSPIRRYPDLLVHRLVKQFMLNEDQTTKNPISYFNKKVNEAGIISSKQERNAESLERDAVEYKKCEYMESFIGKTFNGTIESMTNFGVFIDLDNTVSGLARFSEFYDDYYIYDETKQQIRGTRTKRVFKLGDRVYVRVKDVNKQDRQIDFTLLGKERKHE